MAYDKQYYDEKKQTINIKYVKAMEELVEDMTNTLNKFFTYKGELNEQLREIITSEAGANESEEKGTDDAESTKDGEASEVA